MTLGRRLSAFPTVFALVTLVACSGGDGTEPTPVQRTLTISGSGLGTGSVTSAPSGIGCTITAGVAAGIFCSAAFNEGTAIVLTVTPEGGSTLFGWTGACTGTANCTVTMNANQTAGVQLDLLPPRTLTITGAGTGSGGIRFQGGTCTITAGVGSGTCSPTFVDGRAPLLTPEANADSRFVGWTGDCTGSEACTVTMNGDKAAEAQFDLRPLRTLTVTGSGLGSGAMTSIPTGITCQSMNGVLSGTCTATFFDGTDILLVAGAGGGSVFVSWTGVCAGSGGICNLTMDADKATEAQFDLIPQRTLTVTGSGTGTGTVTSASSLITCTSTVGVESGTCSRIVQDGGSERLTGIAATGSMFVGWTGPCLAGESCFVVLDADKTVDAQFDSIAPALLVGTWNATSVTFAPTGGGTSRDIIGRGRTLSIVLRQDSTYTLTEVDPGPPVVTDVKNGTFTVVGGVLTFTPTGFPADAPLIIQVLTATDMTLFNATEMFDFNADGTETPASLTAVFVKQ